MNWLIPTIKSGVNYKFTKSLLSIIEISLWLINAHHSKNDTVGFMETEFKQIS